MTDRTAWLSELSRVSTRRWADALEAHHVQTLRSRAQRSLPEHPLPPAPPAAPPEREAYPFLRRCVDWYETFARLYGTAVELTFRAPPTSDDDVSSASAGVDAEIVRLLRRIEVLLLKYPVAAQAAYTALVAEGRAFALTEEGARYDAVLRTSRAFEKHWLILEKVTARVLGDSPHAVLPTAYLDAVVQGAQVPDLGLLMGRLFGGGRDGVTE